MSIAWIQIGLAFIEGFALIISPCILPILPFVLSGSLTGNKSRPFGIIVGFILTFTIVTLFSKAIIEYSHINPDTLRNFSFVILLLLGVIMVSSYLTEKFTLLTQGLTRVGSTFESVNNAQGGFISGIIFGGLIGIIWTPCAGPILAAVIVQVVIQQTTLNSLLTVIAFGIGAGLPMLLIALIGRKIIDNISLIRNHTNLLRQLLGVIIILSVVYFVWSSNTIILPTQTQNTTSNISDSSLNNNLNNKKTSKMQLINGLATPYLAPEIAGIDAWINGAPLTLNALKGKVVLIDFWTYSCINCLRTLPYLKDWYAKYHDRGFIIIGIHSPEFQFEHQFANVKNAVIKEGILYPVALDNHFITWQNFNNRYWPAHYLINQQGKVVYQHFGEGDYAVTENNIRYLLGINSRASSKNSIEKYSVTLTPETYLGYERAEHFASRENMVKNKLATYHYPDQLAKNEWALTGDWIIYPDKIVAASQGAGIKLHFNAAKVYAVMGAANTVKSNVLLDNQLITVNQGSDVLNHEITVKTNRLYFLIKERQESDGTIEIITTSKGLEIYTFTFGD